MGVVDRRVEIWDKPDSTVSIQLNERQTIRSNTNGASDNHYTAAASSAPGYRMGGREAWTASSSIG